MISDSESKSLKRTQLMITVTICWHFLLAISGIFVLFGSFIQKGFSGIPVWLSYIASVLIVLLCVGSIYSAIQLLRKRRQGRSISLVVNYIGLIISVIILFQNLGIFLGVDALAKTFGSSIIWLSGVLIGYLIYSLGDKFHYRIKTEEIVHKIGKYMALVFFVIFLIRAGLFQALIFLGKQIIIPSNLIVGIISVLFGIAIWFMWRENTMGTWCSKAHWGLADPVSSVSGGIIAGRGCDSCP